MRVDFQCEQKKELSSWNFVLAERSLEDHESVLQVYRGWGYAEESRFYFRKDERKYEFFHNPSVSSPSEKRKFERWIVRQRQHLLEAIFLLQEFFPNKKEAKWLKQPGNSPDLNRQKNLQLLVNKHLRLNLTFFFFLENYFPRFFSRHSSAFLIRYTKIEKSKKKKKNWNYLADAKTMHCCFQLQHFLENDEKMPDIEGHLLMKDGKKSWKKHFFVLRDSGLYYSTKGTSREPKHLALFSKVTDANIYKAKDAKKTFGAPNNNCFCLKVSARNWLQSWKKRENKKKKANKQKSWKKEK